MSWIWQHPEWPAFAVDQSRLRPLEARFLHEAGRRIGFWRHLDARDQTELSVQWLSTEALEATSTDFLTSAEAIRRQADRLRTGGAEDRQAPICFTAIGHARQGGVLYKLDIMCKRGPRLMSLRRGRHGEGERIHGGGDGVPDRGIPGAVA